MQFAILQTFCFLSQEQATAYDLKLLRAVMAQGLEMFHAMRISIMLAPSLSVHGIELKAQSANYKICLFVSMFVCVWLPRTIHDLFTCRWLFTHEDGGCQAAVK